MSSSKSSSQTRLMPRIQGYLSFWNDNISYALRGCILIELALRRRIALVKDPNRRHLPPAERIVEVIDERQTGETLLDETLKMMKAQEEVERMSVNTWIDLLSGESRFHSTGGRTSPPLSRAGPQTYATQADGPLACPIHQARHGT